MEHMRWDAAVQIQYIKDNQREVQEQVVFTLPIFKGLLGYVICSLTSIWSLNT
jgi:hypothetical protein